MPQAKIWLSAVLVLAVLAGAAVLISPGTPAGAAQEKVVVKDHWRHHDGHWSYWHQGDKRWYYTDGAHWFYEDNGAWRPYRFDRQFGREGFERGEYKVPGEDAKIVVPRHKVYRPR